MKILSRNYGLATTLVPKTYLRMLVAMVVCASVVLTSCKKPDDDKNKVETSKGYVEFQGKEYKIEDAYFFMYGKKFVFYYDDYYLFGINLKLSPVNESTALRDVRITLRDNYPIIGYGTSNYLCEDGAERSSLWNFLYIKNDGQETKELKAGRLQMTKEEKTYELTFEIKPDATNNYCEGYYKGEIRRQIEE